jgi:hypothetical protein
MAKILLIRVLLVIGIALFTIGLLLEQTTAESHTVTVKQRAWGFETWTLGNLALGIQFNETQPVQVQSLVGAFTYSPGISPRPNYASVLQRQALLSLATSDMWAPISDVSCTPQTTPLNQGVYRSYLPINLKQRLEENGRVPVQVGWSPPLQPANNQLFWSVDVRAYYPVASPASPSGFTVVISSNHNDALDLEFQGVVNYTVGAVAGAVSPTKAVPKAWTLPGGKPFQP